MNDIKYVCVIVDDFTELALTFPNVSLLDFGSHRVEKLVDSWSYSYWTNTTNDFGDLDDQYLISENFDYYLANDFFSVTPTNSERFGPDLYDYNPFWGLYMTEEWLDVVTFESISGYNSSSAPVGHGDWVLESFYGNLDDPNSVEVIAIDIDFTDFRDFSYLFSRPTLLGGYSVLESCVSLAFDDFNDANNEY